MADEATRARERDELAAHLRESATDTAPISRVVDVRCDHCGDREFWLYVDETEGYAERNCVGCDAEVLMLDSADVAEDAEDAEPRAVHCWRCQSGMFILAIGFSLREGEDGEVKWVSVGVRCTTCDDMWCCADWSIDYGPSSDLLARV